MTWRYQPVTFETDRDKETTLVEVYFDDDGNLTTWTDLVGACGGSIAPGGESIGDLRADLARMLADAYKWMPVRYEDLRPGMTFERTGVDVEAMIAAMEDVR
jgi:hypothetical protein